MKRFCRQVSLVPGLLGLLCCFAGGGRAQDIGREMAINQPDRFAWHLFTIINKPVADDPFQRVAWEKWALARDVFINPLKAPGWEELEKDPRAEEKLDPIPLQQLAKLVEQEAAGVDIGGGLVKPAFDEAAALGEFNETRMNRATFDFIVKNELYYLEGQERIFKEGTTLAFPLESQEVKAQWRKIKEADAGRYHVAKVKNAEGGETLWGLTAMHITTKDLPNWFWATWEHVDNPRRELVIPSRDSHGLPPELKGTKWENYVLRGTQIDFVDSSGRPTLLANSHVEDGFEATSSCITCHSRSSISDRAGDRRLAVFESSWPLLGSVGSPKREWFEEHSPSGRVKPRFAQLDFVWSLSRAKPRNP